MANPSTLFRPQPELARAAVDRNVLGLGTSGGIAASEQTTSWAGESLGRKATGDGSREMQLFNYAGHN
jgi:hypothetical protein